jgi:hypothetical protein
MGSSLVHAKSVFDKLYGTRPDAGIPTNNISRARWDTKNLGHILWPEAQNFLICDDNRSGVHIYTAHYPRTEFQV